MYCSTIFIPYIYNHSLVRYQVHFYNIDELLMCAFPYHDSNIFTRLLQILDLSKTKSKWHWLQAVQKHGTQLPTQTIATHVYKDEGFLNFVASIPEQFISVRLYDALMWLFILFICDLVLCTKCVCGSFLFFIFLEMSWVVGSYQQLLFLEVISKCLAEFHLQQCLLQFLCLFHT